MIYVSLCACYSRLRGSLLSGISCTPWTAHCLIIILLVFIPGSSHLLASVHTLFQRQCMFSFSACSCGRECSRLFGLNHIYLRGQQGLFNCEVWCGWWDFSGNMHWHRLLTSMCDCISQSVFVAAGLCISYRKSTLLRGDFHGRVALVGLSQAFPLWVQRKGVGVCVEGDQSFAMAICKLFPSVDNTIKLPTSKYSPHVSLIKARGQQLAW